MTFKSIDRCYDFIQMKKKQETTRNMQHLKETIFYDMERLFYHIDVLFSRSQRILILVRLKCMANFYKIIYKYSYLPCI